MRNNGQYLPSSGALTVPDEHALSLDLSLAGDGPEQEPRVVEYFRLLRRHWRTIAVASAVVGAATAVWAFVATPLYTAESQLLIERRSPQVLDVRELLADGMTGDESAYYRTQEQILESRLLATEVIRELDLDRNPYFASSAERRGLVAGWIASLRAKIVELGRGDHEPVRHQPGETDPRLLEAYRSALGVSPVSRTRLAVIQFTTPDPNLSAQIVNAHAQAYIQHGLRLKSEASDDARRFLEHKLGELRDRVEASEVALNAYRRDKGIVSLDEKENIIVDRLSDLNDMLSVAEAERIGFEAKVKLIQKRDYDSLPDVSNNTLIQTIKSQLAEIERGYVELSARFKPSYPAVEQSRAQVEAMRKRLENEIRQVVGTIESAYLAAADNEKQLRKITEEQKSKVLELKDASVQYAILKRESDANRELYDSILQRMKEIGVAAAVQASNVSVIDKAVPPQQASYPKRVRSILLALFAGAAMGVGLVIGRHHLDSSLKSLDDVERYLGLPSLGVVPDFDAIGDQRHSYSPSSDTRLIGAGKARIGPPARADATKATGSALLAAEPFSVITESYRTLRTAILFSQPESAPQTMLFTSALEAEGKTTSALNTACVFGRLGARVLVIDADLRRASCHKRLNTQNRQGLSEVLTGQASLEEMVRKRTSEGFDLLSAGSLPPNPTELLGSRAMMDLLRRAAETYDYVIVDSPPVMAVNDAVVLSPLVDGVVLVVKAHDTPRQILQRAERRLNQAHAKILGVLLNQVDARSDHYATYYGGNYYSSYYQSGEEQVA